MKDMTMGRRISEERKKLGLSQEALGDRMGVSRQAISKWESDGAVPEIDKLIALSRLFGVSVGWLLGVEAQAAPESGALTETQLALVEELVKKYCAPSPLISKWQQVLAVCMVASIFICLFAMQITNARQENAISGKTDTSVYSGLSARVDALESQMQTFSQSAAVTSPLLADYTIDVLPADVTEDSTPRARIYLTAVPSVWNPGDTGYLCVSGGSMEPFRVKCDWDGGHLSASTVLDATDKYQLCFAVEHDGGSQEQQVLENDAVQNLTEAFTIPMSVIPGTWECKENTLTLKDYVANFDCPPIYGTAENCDVPVICEYRLYRKPSGDTLSELLRCDMIYHLKYLPVEEDFQYQVAGANISFENIDIENTDYWELFFYVKFGNGMEEKHLITLFFPDGNGGITE